MTASAFFTLTKDGPMTSQLEKFFPIRSVVLISFLAMYALPSSAYILFSTGAIKQCSLIHAKKSEFKICLRGAANRPNFERLKEYSAISAYAWLKLYKKLDYGVTTKVAFSCESPALTVNILNGNGRSYATSGQAWIYEAVPANVHKHEYGHALAGLSDTYAGGACQCKSGQPQSLMCCAASGARGDHTKFSGFYDDDILGGTEAYRIVHGYGTTPTIRSPEFSLFNPIKLLMPFEGLDIEDTQNYVEEDFQVQILQGERLTPINWQAEFE